MWDRYPAAKDQSLVQIVDAAFADAARRSGSWLLCRAGCTPCCVGAFPINQLDAMRLREGLSKLATTAPDRAHRIRERALGAVARLSAAFPGDAATGLLDEGEEAAQRFEQFGDDEACPVLNPETGTCELYESRPITCRVFGPPVRSEGGLGVCELCFRGATNREIAACEIRPDPDGLEARLLTELENASGISGDTIIAFCLGL